MSGAIRRRNRTALAGLAIVCYFYIWLKKYNKKQKRRWWVRPINQNRRQQGDYHNLIQEMRLGDPEMFFNYTRLTVEQFDEVLACVSPVITKNSYREPICAGARLAITLRHLAGGDSIPSLAFSYRIGKSTTCNIINETCEALWLVLKPKVLKEVVTEDWEQISQDFELTWNLPNCVGALDGKHVVITAPHNSGSQYFNYKKNFSIVLLAVCDAKYRFSYVDIGAYGSQSDGGVLRLSSFGHKLHNNLLGLPENKPFPGLRTPTPLYFVGDEAFPLHVNLMRPFGGRVLPVSERIFNYRLSRARRCIENAFGIMVARFRIFHTTINKFPENIDKVIQACVCLHNFIKKKEDNMASINRRYCGPTFADHEVDGVLIEGEWRNENPGQTALRPINELRRRMGARNFTQTASEYRNYIKDYVNSDAGSVEWQNQAINP
jgi:hypothetical protein